MQQNNIDTDLAKIGPLRQNIYEHNTDKNVYLIITIQGPSYYL